MVSKFRQPGSDLLTFVFVAFALLPFLLDPEVIPNPTSLESGSSVALMCERCSLFATAEAGRGFPEVIDVLIAAGANPDRSFWVDLHSKATRPLKWREGMAFEGNHPTWDHEKNGREDVVTA